MSAVVKYDYDLLILLADSAVGQGPTVLRAVETQDKMTDLLEKFPFDLQ